MADIVISLDWGNVVLLVGVTTIGLSAVGKWLIERTTKGFDAYTQEKMKNIATKQDIQVYVNQVRETERVKADISDRVWDRQAQWKARSDAYVNLLKQITLCRLALGKVYEHDDPSKIRDAMNAFSDIGNEFRQAILTAQLFVPEAVVGHCNAAADALRHIAEKLDRNPAIDIDTDIDTIDSARASIVEIGRTDLGYKPF